MHAYANPARFMTLSNALLPWVALVAGGFLAAGLYLGLVASGPERYQGEGIRMMYVHVPAVWTAMMAYALIAAASLVSLVWRHPLAAVAAKTAAPLGAIFTALGLITGSIWGRPMWNTWWVWWDGRLDAFLLLFFIYLGYIALWDTIEDETRAARATAILALVGAADLIAIKFSVDWLNTLHQCDDFVRVTVNVPWSKHACAASYAANPHPMAGEFLWPLFTMALGYTFLFFALWLLRIQTEIMKRRARNLMLSGK